MIYGNSQLLPVVLIGCGAVSQLFYAPSLGALFAAGKLTVVALVDPDSTARGVMARHFADAALADRIDAVPDAIAPVGSLCIVATPPKLHFPVTNAAYARGWHVLCEKPIASTLEEATAMCVASAKFERLLAVGHYKRFMPTHRAIKLLIENQVLGRLEEIQISEGGKFVWPSASDSFFRSDQTPGGVLLDIGVHVLDLLLWWLGNPSDYNYSDDARDGLEANCLLTAQFPQPGRQGSTVSVRMRLSRDWVTPNCYVFHFERAIIHCRVNASNQLELTLDGLPMTLAAELRDPLPKHPAPPTTALETNAQAFIAQLLDVYSAVRERRPPMVTGEDGTRVIGWIERCYAGRKRLEEPWQRATVRDHS